MRFEIQTAHHTRKRKVSTVELRDVKEIVGIRCGVKLSKDTVTRIAIAV